MYNHINYFKGLNTLRFGAAFLVLIHHGESMKIKNGMPALGSISLFHNGANAVFFFFVLSGFLITYLLLKEKKATRTVNVRKFYMKRVFRIWPLYYLLVVIGTLLVPFAVNVLNVDYEIPYTFHESWYWFVFFLPGLVTFYYGHHLLEPLWSIGVEELFYLIWAPLFKFVKENILLLLILVVVVKVILASIPFFINTSPLYNVLVNMHCFEAMAIGGIGAYFIFHTKKAISSLFLYKRGVQVLIYLILLVFVLFNRNLMDNGIWNAVFNTPIISRLLLYFLFLYLIIGVALAENNVLKLENKLFSYFGEISYGIYMYHTTIISIAILLLKKSPLTLDHWSVNIIYYLTITLGTLFIAHLSKKYIENYFLRLKDKI